MQGTNAQRWDPWEPPPELLRSFPGWLRTVEMYSFTAPKAGRSQPRRPGLALSEGSRGKSFHRLFPAPPAAGGPWRPLVCRRVTLLSASIVPWRPPDVSASEFPSSHRFNLMTSAKTLFPYKVTLTGPGD